LGYRRRIERKTIRLFRQDNKTMRSFLLAMWPEGTDANVRNTRISRQSRGARRLPETKCNFKPKNALSCSNRVAASSSNSSTSARLAYGACDAGSAPICRVSSGRVEQRFFIRSIPGSTQFQLNSSRAHLVTLYRKRETISSLTYHSNHDGDSS
jgi:hypothetical protein